MKLSLEQLREMILPMIRSIDGRPEQVADAMVEIIKQDREATVWQVEYELANMVAQTWYERNKSNEAHEVLDRELVLKVIKKAIGETDDKTK